MQVKHHRTLPHTASLSLTAKMALSYSLLVFLVLALTLGYLLMERTDSLVQNIDACISDLSYTLSKNPDVIRQTEEKQFSPDMIQYLSDIESHSANVDLVVICDASGTRLYHQEQEKMGNRFNGGDEEAALAGSPTYITERTGSHEPQRRSFTSIYNASGECIGFVFVSCYVRSINLLKQREWIQYGLIFVLALGIGILFALVIAKNIRKSLLGYDPKQITHMYLQREEVLDSLEEGLIMANTSGICEYSNLPAKRLFAHDPMQTVLQPYIQQTLDTGKSTINYQYQLHGTLLYMTLIPIRLDRQIVSVLILLRDKTDMIKMAEELTGVNHIIAALRANTHEHKNKLHVILGMLQLGETQMAIEYINNSITNDLRDYSFLLNAIENKTLAALILGKMNRAKELNITFNLLKGSHLDKKNPFLSTSDLITITGNLIENAFDSFSDADQTKVREINLFLQNTSDGITIIVDDTGCGISKETLEKVRGGGFTSKGEGHGIGLSLIQNIMDKVHGSLTIESEEGEGSSFSVSVLSADNES